MKPVKTSTKLLSRWESTGRLAPKRADLFIAAALLLVVYGLVELNALIQLGQ